MNQAVTSPTTIKRTYFTLILLNTLASSFIWGINTIFLLEAGLSNFEAFAANAFFTAGQVLFEVPTGIIADTYGRRISYLLGAFTLIISTLLYLALWYMTAPFWMWALSSMLLGLGFTFFSGATEAWLVDALHFTGFKGNIDSVFAKGQIGQGIGMLAGSVLGGVVAELTNLGVPYILRAIVLGITFIIAFILMKDLGFASKRTKSPIKDIRQLLHNSIQYGLQNPPVRWIMLAAVFTYGVSFYVFYALQPYLLEIYGDENAYGIAGLVAAIAAGAQIIGGFSAPFMRKVFHTRTSLLLAGSLFIAITLLAISLSNNFYIAIFFIFIWGLLSAAIMPTRQAYINGLIPSGQRATVLSFDSLMGSSGGIVSQPILGKVADVTSYAGSFMIAAVIHSLAIPFFFLAKKEQASSDIIQQNK